MAKPVPDQKDVPIPLPPSRFSDPDSVQYAVTDLYGAARIMAVLERQARAALIAQGQIADLMAVSALSLTVSNPPTQAEVQSIVTKLNEAIAKQAEVITVLAALKSAASTNIVSLAQDPEG